MSDQRGSALLNVLLVLVVVGAVAFVVLPRVFGEDPVSQNATARDQLVPAYQTWRVQVASRPKLLNAPAKTVAALLNHNQQLEPVGVKKGVAAPGVANKVYVTTKTGKDQHFQAVVLSESGETCVITAKGYDPPAFSGC